MSDTPPVGPLAGVRVLDLGTMITAPLASMMLADLGADVLKIEHPHRGDPFRSAGVGTVGLYGPNYIAYNHNKKSMKLNLAVEAGREIFHKLLADADVLVENYRAGVMGRLGFSAEALRALNPRLIHCSITGFGSTGPYRSRPAYDTVGVGLSGIGSQMMYPDNPELLGPTMSDNVTGLFACQGVLAALHERHRTGVGRHVEVNMLEASIAFIPDPFAALTRNKVDYEPISRASNSQCFAFRCADDRLMILHLSIPDKFWLKLLEGLGRQDLAEDPRFSSRAARVKNYRALDAALAEIIKHQPYAYWHQRFEEWDVPFAPVNRIADVFEDPQVVHLKTFCESEHPTEGRVVNIRSPILLDGERADIAAPPTLGENTDEVLTGLGYSVAEIGELRAGGVV